MSLTGLYEDEDSGYRYINRPGEYYSYISNCWHNRILGLETGSFRQLIFKKYKL